jgi:anaerobic selenocysteine-containing dehydrogenase
MIRNGSELVEASWDEAMDLITSRSTELLESRGPLSHSFYTAGQLMLEEYYTLSVIGKAGLGTPHMDGNTRLCTATAAASLKESFGADGQPGSYATWTSAKPFSASGTTWQQPRPSCGRGSWIGWPDPIHRILFTGRAPELNAAAPEPWVELALSDAADLDLSDGDPVRVESRRGAVEVVVRCTGNRPGTLFLPFHYGDPDTAANDLTPTSWDPVSKQPHFKSGAGRVVRQVSDDASVLISGSVGDRLRDPRALLPAGRRGSSGRG